MRTHRILISLVATRVRNGPALARAGGRRHPRRLPTHRAAQGRIGPAARPSRPRPGAIAGRGAELRRWRAEAQGSDLMCRACFEKGDYVSAERACDAAVLAGGESAWSYVYHRGVMRLLLGRVDEGVADLRRAASMGPSDRGCRCASGHRRTLLIAYGEGLRLTRSRMRVGG